MTEAYVPPKNDTASKEKTGNIKEKSHGNNNFNTTTIINEEGALNQSANVNQYQVHDVANNTSNKTSEPVHNCTQESKTNCNLTNFLDSETVLKYIYKKDDNVNVSEKTKGHAKNSLRRKRNVVNLDKESVAESAPVIINYQTLHPPKEREHLVSRNTANVIQRADLADFNIETLHENIDLNKDLGEVENKYKTQNDNLSKSRSVFSGENKENQDDYREKNKTHLESDESNERGDYRDEPVHRSRESESEERNYSNDDKVIQSKSSEETNSRESEESIHINPTNSRESHERNENSENESKEILDKDDNKADIKSAYEHLDDESREDDDRGPPKPVYEKKDINDSDSREAEENKSIEENKPVYRNRHNDNIEKNSKYDDNENTYSRNNDKSSYTNSDNESREKSNTESKQDSNESEEEEEIIAIMTKKNRKPHTYEPGAYKNDETRSNASSPFKIRDVDIGDFSYERIHVNDKGVVETAKDPHENYDTDSLPEKPPLDTPKLDSNYNNEKYSIDTTNTNVRDETNLDINKQTHINDGEVKPVVEINSDSGESNGDDSKAAFKANTNEDVSLETLIGVKETDSDEQNEKIISSQGEDQQKNVKQQFERIPLNYKHDDKEQKHNTNDKEPILPQNPSEANNKDEPYNPSNTDVFQPNEHSYDENLNIKFDDLTIKLPEIKLPKDILAYDVEDSHDPHKHTSKQKFFEYSEESSDEEPHHEKKRKNKKGDDDHDVDFDHGYRGYYKVDNEKNDDDDDEEDEDEDLYEKFVRERFGKKGSFGTRSEKLLDVRPIEQNSDLYNTLKQVLKKTEDINKEAKKSGDPNAGYMWTLEYGQKL